MSFFDSGNGVYLRAPDSGVEHGVGEAAPHFKWIALNLEYPLAEWTTIRTRAEAAGLTVIPWKRLYTADELELFCDTAEHFPACILNIEKELDDGAITPDDILKASDGLDCVISMEPWLFDSVDWFLLADFPFHLQLFPQENSVSHMPEACRAHAYAYGIKKVQFMFGIHSLEPYDFVRQGPYGVYTGDDMDSKPDLVRDYAAWAEQKVAPLAIPYTGPSYGPSHKKGPMKSKTALALKIGMDRLGFDLFPNPDLFHNRRLEEALRRAQRFAGLEPSGQFGKATFEWLRRQLALDGSGYALNSLAVRMIKEDANG